MKEAIVYIPGVNIKTLGQSVNDFAAEFSESQSVGKVLEPKPVILKSYSGKNIRIKHKESDEVSDIDIYEAFWGDIFQRFQPQGKSVIKKFKWGTKLISYWLFSKLWKALFTNKYMFFWFTISGIFLMVWFSSILFVAIGAAQDATQNLFASSDYGLISKLYNYIPAFFEQNYTYSVFIALVLSILPINRLLHMTGFIKDYLTTSVLRNEIHERVLQLVNNIESTGKYEKITIMSSSMGTLITLDFMSSFKKNRDYTLDVITIWSPISFICLRSKWARDKVIEMCGNSSINLWYDYFSKHDWLCSYKNIKNISKSDASKFISFEVNSELGLLDRFSSKVHNNYFKNPSVVDSILNR